MVVASDGRTGWGHRANERVERERGGPFVTINDGDATLASDGCRLLTIDAAADFLAISRGAVYHLLDRGEVTSIHIGRSRRIALAELRRFVAKSGHMPFTVAS
jgi:excisionase family DNA binding protein